MPSHSRSQRRAMAAAAHDPEFAAKLGIPQAVGKEYNRADQKVNVKALPERVRKKAKPLASR